MSRRDALSVRLCLLSRGSSSCIERHRNGPTCGKGKSEVRGTQPAPPRGVHSSTGMTPGPYMNHDEPRRTAKKTPKSLQRRTATNQNKKTPSDEPVVIPVWNEHHQRTGNDHTLGLALNCQDAAAAGHGGPFSEVLRPDRAPAPHLSPNRSLGTRGAGFTSVGRPETAHCGGAGPTPRPGIPIPQASPTGCLKTAAPLHPYTPTPLNPYAPVPLHPYTPTPLYPYTPTPLHPYTPTPLHPYTPTPPNPHTPLTP